MAAFDWLERARKAVNKSSEFRGLGTTDIQVAFKAGKVAHLVSFDAFEVAAARELDPEDLRDADIVIDMPSRDWTNYLKRRKSGTGPSLLSLDVDRGIVSARDPLNLQKFERYHLSVQAYVDAGAS